MTLVPTNCTSGDVRLVNGSSDSEGIVEVCYQGVWTTVAGNSYYWDYRDARVLCVNWDTMISVSETMIIAVKINLL